MKGLTKSLKKNLRKRQMKSLKTIKKRTFGDEFMKKWNLRKD